MDHVCEQGVTLEHYSLIYTCCVEGTCRTYRLWPERVCPSYLGGSDYSTVVYVVLGLTAAATDVRCSFAPVKECKYGVDD